MDSIAYTPNIFSISGVSLNTPESVFSGKIVVEKEIIVNGKNLLEIIYVLQTKINQLETRRTEQARTPSRRERRIM